MLRNPGKLFLSLVVLLASVLDARVTLADGGVDVPVLDAPVLDAPVLDAPVLDAPVTDTPMTDAGVPDITTPDIPPPDRPDASDVVVPDVPRPPDAPVDSGGPFCGDGMCGSGESCSTCAMDCGACRTCGDGVCTAPETCGTCPFDCFCADAGTDVPLADVARDAIVPDGPAIDASPGDVGPLDAPSDGGSPTDRSGSDTPLDLPVSDSTVDVPPPMDLRTMDAPDVTVADVSRDTVDGDTPTDLPADRPTDAPRDTMCNRLPSSTASSNFMVSLRAATPSALGTRGEVSAESGGMLSSGFRGSGDMPECYMGASLGGQIRVCVAVGGQETCQSAGLSVSADCTIPAVCNTPPAWTCDESRSCCTGTLSGNVGLTRTWEWGPRIGTWIYNFTIGVGVMSSVSGRRVTGPGCPCTTGETDARVTVTGSGMGGGTVGVRLFGYEYTLAANAGVCVQIGGQLRVGCGVGATPVAGAAVSIGIPSVKLGFFTFEWNHRWEVGSGC